MRILCSLALCATFQFLLSQQVQAAERSFRIDYVNNGFLKDGEPFRVVSGSIHYFRVHPRDWADRLYKLRYAGFNAVQTYVEWSSHEPQPGNYDFGGFNNLTKFIETAQEQDLLVIIRPGPFIDAERDMGGLPSWLIGVDPEMKIRSMDSGYMQYVERWFGVLLPMIKPFLYSEGGPVVMVQIENEYGSYPSCDFAYTSRLREVTRSALGPQALLYTTDGDSTSWLKCGKVQDVYATVDFGPGSNVTAAFEAQRLFEPRGPLMNSEFYPGWLDHWGEPHSTVSTEAVVATLEEMLAANASVNVYVAHGGTSFGLTAGSNLGSKFQACPTSYDYDAPLSEAGDLTEKYWAMRDVIGKYHELPDLPAPTNSSKAAYGAVVLTPVSNVLSAAISSASASASAPDTRYTATVSTEPMSFEALNYTNGLVLYAVTVPYDTTDPALLSITAVHDRAYVYLDQTFVGILDREQQVYSIPLFARKGQKLNIMAESLGRICYGSEIRDSKGIFGPVKLGGHRLTDWTHVPIDLQLSEESRFAPDAATVPLRLNPGGAMTVFEGSWTIADETADTFLRLDGWTKGFAEVNGFLLGRYWPVVGPQKTLYVPRGVLGKGDNKLRVLELEAAPCGAEVGTSEVKCEASFVAEADIAGSTPQS